MGAKWWKLIDCTLCVVEKKNVNLVLRVKLLCMPERHVRGVEV